VRALPLRCVFRLLDLEGASGPRTQGQGQARPQCIQQEVRARIQGAQEEASAHILRRPGQESTSRCQGEEVMVEEIVTRLLREQIPNANFSLIDGDEAASSVGWGQYTNHESAGYIWKVYFGYFDLSGYTLEQKTTFIQNVMFQNVGNNRLGGMITDGPISECRIVSTTPLHIEDFVTSSHSSWAVPGTPTSNFSTQQIVQGTMLEYQMDTGAAIGRVSQGSSWGAGDSTAAEKLYYARAFRFPRGTLTYYATFPSVNVIVPVVIGEEPDLEYLMRLKRSIELAE